MQVKETLSDDILAKIHAPPKDADVPIIDPAQLPDFDGYIFGFPTRSDGLHEIWVLFGCRGTQQIWHGCSLPSWNE